jgi:hypothetical protein
VYCALKIAARAAARLPEFLANASFAQARRTDGSAGSPPVGSPVGWLARAAAAQRAVEWRVDVRPCNRRERGSGGAAVAVRVRMELDPVLEAAEVAAAGL